MTDAELLKAALAFIRKMARRPYMEPCFADLRDIIAEGANRETKRIRAEAREWLREHEVKG